MDSNFEVYRKYVEMGNNIDGMYLLFPFLYHCCLLWALRLPTYVLLFCIIWIVFCWRNTCRDNETLRCKNSYNFLTGCYHERYLLQPSNGQSAGVQLLLGHGVSVLLIGLCYCSPQFYGIWIGSSCSWYLLPYLDGRVQRFKNFWEHALSFNHLYQISLYDSMKYGRGVSCSSKNKKKKR